LRMNTIRNLEFSCAAPQRLMNAQCRRACKGLDPGNSVHVRLQETFADI
jgi:hypothetical protein